VHIVIDDFGTGYSALSYLNQLPVDGLKIDRSFVQGLGSEREKTAIVSATIAFAHGLGLAVTAEGIETEDQLQRLMALKCNLGQGFLFARPLDAQTMASTLPAAYPLPQSGARRSGNVTAHPATVTTTKSSVRRIAVAR